MGKDRIIALRLTTEQYAVLADAARRDDRSVSSYIRIHIINRAARDLGVLAEEPAS